MGHQGCVRLRCPCWIRGDEDERLLFWLLPTPRILVLPRHPGAEGRIEPRQSHLQAIGGVDVKAAKSTLQKVAKQHVDLIRASQSRQRFK